jgi:transcriptional regulator with XRE-family HTH domain
MTMSRDNRRAFGQYIRKLRLEKKLTQEALAEKAKLHPTYIGGIERGERNVSLDNIFKIAKALDVSASELFL